MMTSSEVSSGVDLTSLRPGALVDVETTSRHYRIECLGGVEIRISGHPEHCPAPVLAQVQGSIDDEGSLDVGQIEPGRRLMFFLNHTPVLTSTIVGVHVDRF